MPALLLTSTQNPPQQAPAAQAMPPPQAAPQQPAAPGVNPSSICGREIPPPANLPPAGSPPVVYLIVPCFAKQGGSSVVEFSTYQYYMQLPPSRPSQNKWTPYDAQAEKTIEDDFKRLWATNFLDDLSIEAIDYRFANGVLGKIIVYDMEERQRVKIVDYEGNKHVETTKIEDKLKEDNVRIGLDSFIDQGLITKVKNAVLTLEGEKGYEFATVTPKVVPIEGQAKTVHLTFVVDEGPKVRIREIAFVGNKAMSGRALKRQMKNNKQQWFLSFITSRGTYQRAKYEEDADKITSYYRDHGYIAVRVGEPELKYLEDSTDRGTRWVQLRIPIVEGDRFKVASLKFDGNKVVKTEFLQGLFKLKPGDWYSDKVVRKGLEKAQEAYGTVGYFEFTGYPDLTPEGQATPDQPGTEAPKTDQASGKGPAENGAGGQQAGKAAAGTSPAAKPAAAKPGPKGPPRVDVVMRMQEGRQYFVHRITFEGNTTTRDNVVRREMRLFEGGVFNTEALKYSVKRINQLGYFKNLEGGKDMVVEKTPGTDNQVDVTLKVQEQNRNQITFGAGVSQFEGFFGQLGFQTANFMGRGETFNVSLQAGSLAQLFQVGFTEPFLFDRNLTGGINLFKNRYDFINQFTQASTGGNLTVGFPVGRGFSRMFINYSYEHSKVEDINPALVSQDVLNANPYLAETLLMSMNGNRVVSKITPSFVYNSIDNPIFPSAGRRFTASIDLAGIGGDTNFYKPIVEGVWYLPIGGSPSHQARTTLGLRAQAQYLSPFTGSPSQLPIFEKLVLGGEYSVRGFDLRSIGPKAAGSDLVIGGNKSLLFNAEYIITIAGPVRLVLFADAGQVRDVGEPFALKEAVTQTVYTGGTTPLLFDPYATSSLHDPSVPVPVAQTVTLGYRDAFKTSVGAEVRFFMPVLNVPFRLIFAANPSRGGVLDNSFQPQKAFSFRFAVGTTF
jgi:outer membrane protein insertion porin family